MSILDRDKKWALATAVLVTISVVVIYFVARFVGESFLNLEMTDTSAIFLSLIPFVAYLVAFGKISEFGGGGFTLKFAKASEAEVNFKKEEAEGVVYIEEEDVRKEGMKILYEEVLPAMAKNPRSALKIEKKNDAYYNFSALKTYLEELTKFDSFKYVLFVEEGDVFKGFLNARSLLLWFSARYEPKGNEIITKINNWNVDKIEGFRDNNIRADQSNKEALRMMEDLKISEIAVVDKDKKFLGFTDRQIITSRILNLMTKRE